MMIGAPARTARTARSMRAGRCGARPGAGAATSDTRQVELARSSGDAGALLDRHEPFVVPQVRPDLAGLRRELRADGVDLREQLLERALLDLRILAQRPEHLLLAFELLQEDRS
jgi:hypothetical protein